MSVALRGVPFVLQSLATTGNGNACSVNPAVINHQFTVQGDGTIAAGTIIIEEASDEAYAGTWSQLFAFAASSVTGGQQSVLHVAGVMRAVRARISVNITGGGTVTVTFMSAGSV